MTSVKPYKTPSVILLCLEFVAFFCRVLDASCLFENTVVQSYYYFSFYSLGSCNLCLYKSRFHVGPLIADGVQESK